MATARLLEVPRGFAFGVDGALVDITKVLAFATPSSKAGLPFGQVYVSFSSDFTGPPQGVPRLRIAVGDGVGWAYVGTIDVPGDGVRHTLPNFPPPPAGGPAYTFSVGRYKTSATDASADVPIAVLVEIGSR